MGTDQDPLPVTRNSGSSPEDRRTPSKGKPRFARRVATVILLPAVAVAISLAAGEAIIRFVRPQVLPSQKVVRGFVLRGMFLQDDEAGYVPAPNFRGTMDRGGIVTDVSTNSMGLRAQEIGPRNPGTVRIAVFGDSFTFGWGVPQGQEWVSVAERRINHELGTGAVELVNCGVIGYGTENEAILLERLAGKLQADIVLLGFFANDYMDNFLGARGFYTVREEYLFDQWTHEYFHERFLQRESHLARLCSSAWGTASQRWLKAAPAMRSGQRLSARDYAVGAKRSVHLIRRMRDSSGNAQARFGVIWLPPDDYALPAQPPNVAEQIWLQARIAEDGIASLDLLPLVRAQADRASFYYPNDGHFTVSGNQFAGDAVARWIIDAYLRGPDPNDDSVVPTNARTRSRAAPRSGRNRSVTRLRNDCAGRRPSRSRAAVA